MVIERIEDLIDHHLSTSSKRPDNSSHTTKDEDSHSSNAGSIDGEFDESDQALARIAESIWLDNITREMLTTAPCAATIDDLSVTGPDLESDFFDEGSGNTSALRHRHTPEGGMRAGPVKKLSSIGRGGLRRAADRSGPW